MKYDDYTALCTALGNQNLPATQRWKSLSYILADNTTRFDVQDLYNKNRFYSIGDGVSSPTGFLLVEHSPAEFRIITKNVVTFIGLDAVSGLSFVAADNENIESALAKLGVTLNFTVEFSSSSYVLDSPMDVPRTVAYKVSEPVNVVIGIWKEKAKRDAATSREGSLSRMDAAGTYYLRAFAGNNGSVTADCTVEIKHTTPTY